MKKRTEIIRGEDICSREGNGLVGGRGGAEKCVVEEVAFGRGGKNGGRVGFRYGLAVAARKRRE